ncbi:MAG: hypothetical protein KAS75_04870, partial [Planctomycetes bacterium]|nr:hypothetical protein [Planctomycetota bacterium]
MFQNKFGKSDGKAVFIIDGGEKLGFGHFTRTTQIAKYLAEKKNRESIFITSNSLLSKKVEQLGFKFYFVEAANETAKDMQEICQIVKSQACRTVVIDMKSDHNSDYIIELLKENDTDMSITLIDNFTSARLLADKNLYPVPKQLVSCLSWQGYTGKVYSGLKYFPLKDEIINIVQTEKQNDCVVVMMGASDPNNLTSLVMNSLADTGKKIKVIIGPGFIHKDEINKITGQYSSVFELYDNPADYMKVVSSAALAVTALGVSIYELAYLRIPVLVIANYKSDMEAGRILEESGYCKFMGYYGDLRANRLKDVLPTIDVKKS